MGEICVGLENLNKEDKFGGAGVGGNGREIIYYCGFFLKIV